MKRKTRAKNYLKANPPVNLRSQINRAYRKTDRAETQARKEVDRLYKSKIDVLIGKITGFMSEHNIKSFAEAKKYHRLDALFDEMNEEIKGLSVEERQLLVSQKMRTYKEAYKDTSISYGDTLGVSFGGPNKKSLDAFKEMPVLGTEIKNETENKRRNLENAVRGEVNRGLILGENPLQIAKRIAKAGKIAQYRARALARTNVIAAHGQAVIDFRENNSDIFKGVRWFTQLDERTCPICAPLNGKDFYKEQPPHPAHYNCRCALNPIAETAIQRVLDSAGQFKITAEVA